MSNEKIEKWEKKLEGYKWNTSEFETDFEVCDFGSCQYSCINEVFKLVSSMLDDLPSVETVLDLLCIDFYIVDDADINKYYDLLWEDKINYDRLFPADDDNSRRHSKEIEELLDSADISNLNDYFTITRSMSWDLWTALANIEDLLNVTPSADIETINFNIVCGIECAFLLYYGYVTDETYFHNFDT